MESEGAPNLQQTRLRHAKKKWLFKWVMTRREGEKKKEGGLVEAV